MRFLFNKNDVYTSKTFLYQYNDNNFRVVLQKFCKNKGFEEINKQETFIKQTEDEELQRVSLSRTKRNIREIALCNEFTHFATLTINSRFNDRFSLTECQNVLKKKIQNKIRKKNKDFAYIFITEKHKDGAFHFHGLVKNLDFYTNKNGYLSNKVFDEIGFNSFSEIRDFDKTCNYITKYITKDCVKNENNQIYISSRGLKKATKYEIDNINIDWAYENDYCKIRDFNVNDLKSDELIKMMNIKER